jgi:hypothetical protein
VSDNSVPRPLPSPAFELRSMRIEEISHGLLAALATDDARHLLLMRLLQESRAALRAGIRRKPMPIFNAYLDVDVSVTTHSARFAIEARDRDAATAILAKLVRDGDGGDYDSLTYPPETVSGGVAGCQRRHRFRREQPRSLFRNGYGCRRGPADAR